MDGIVSSLDVSETPSVLSPEQSNRLIEEVNSSANQRKSLISSVKEIN